MLLRFLVAALLTVIAAPPLMAQAAPARKSTVTAVVPAPDDRARAWLVLVDDKNYAQSWSDSAAAFKSRHNSGEAWSKLASSLRAPLGATASRNLKSIDLSRTNTAVIQYDSAFAHKAAAVETVTLTFQNGTWAVADYAVQ